MRQFKNSLIASGGMMLLLGAIPLLSPQTGKSQSGDIVGPTKPVQIVNSDTEPVPIALMIHTA